MSLQTAMYYAKVQLLQLISKISFGKKRYWIATRDFEIKLKQAQFKFWDKSDEMNFFFLTHVSDLYKRTKNTIPGSICFVKAGVTNTG